MRKRATVQALVAVLITGVLAAACDDDPARPKMDARPADAGSDARDGSSPDGRVPDAGSPDGAASDAPATDAPASDAPATDAPASDAPASDAPAADAPAIDAPAADADPDTTPPVDSPVVDGAGDDAGSEGGSTQGTDAGIACAGGVSREMVCANYCQAITFFCTGASAQFPSAAACLEACNAPVWACGMLGQPTGNSLFCRISQLAGAITAAPIACPNAGPNSAVCR
jgi:hypothetical protein